MKGDDRCTGAHRGERLIFNFGAWYKHRYNCVAYGKGSNSPQNLTADF